MALTRQEAVDALAGMLDQQSLDRLVRAVKAVDAYTGYGVVSLTFHKMAIIKSELNLTDKGASSLQEDSKCAKLQ
jgi:hypothetical protein